MVYRTIMLAYIAAVFSAPAAAQCYQNGVLCNSVQPSDLDALRAAIPTPASAVPPMDTNAGSVGNALQYQPAGGARPNKYRTGSCQLAASAMTCTGSWDGGAFPDGVSVQNIGDPGIINTAGGAPYTCNYTAVTVSSFSVTCQQAKTATATVNVLGGSLSLFPFAAPAAAVTVTATAIIKSQ